MALRIWATETVWTTRLLMEARYPGMRGQVVLPRVSVSDPPDIEAAIDERIDVAILDAQRILAGWLKANGRTDDELPVTLETTAGILELRTAELAYAQLHSADPGRAVPQPIEALRQGVEAWAMALKKGETLMDSVEEEPAPIDLSPKRELILMPTGRSNLGAEARRLLS
jgi:hypothetical protein